MGLEHINITQSASLHALRIRRDCLSKVTDAMEFRVVHIHSFTAPLAAAAACRPSIFLVLCGS